MQSYCFDTSSWVEAWTRSYPRDVFPSFWALLEPLIEGQAIVCPEDVVGELANKDDGLHRWAKSRSGLVYPMDSEQWEKSREIGRVFPKFLKEGSSKNRGDTWVIALARVTGRCVVTEEVPSEAPHKVLKIPDICDHYGVRWINLLTFMREQKWTI